MQVQNTDCLGGTFLVHDISCIIILFYLRILTFSALIVRLAKLSMQLFESYVKRILNIYLYVRPICHEHLSINVYLMRRKINEIYGNE